MAPREPQRRAAEEISIKRAIWKLLRECLQEGKWQETDPAGSLSMLVSNTACLEILPSRRGKNSRLTSFPTGWKGR